MISFYHTKNTHTCIGTLRRVPRSGHSYHRTSLYFTARKGKIIHIVKEGRKSLRLVKDFLSDFSSFFFAFPPFNYTSDSCITIPGAINSPLFSDTIIINIISLLSPVNFLFRLKSLYVSRDPIGFTERKRNKTIKEKNHEYPTNT